MHIVRPLLVALAGLALYFGLSRYVARQEQALAAGAVSLADLYRTPAWFDGRQLRLSGGTFHTNINKGGSSALLEQDGYAVFATSLSTSPGFSTPPPFLVLACAYYPPEVTAFQKALAQYPELKKLKLVSIGQVYLVRPKPQRLATLKWVFLLFAVLGLTQALFNGISGPEHPHQRRS